MLREAVMSGSGRLRSLAALALPLALLAGCAVGGDADEEPGAASEDAIIESMQAGPASAFPEAVQILHGDGENYCTGVLVSETVVLGAAHCIWDTSHTVIAPFATGAPRRKVVSKAVVSRAYSTDPAAPDVGVLVLDAPIELSQYAIPTSIGSAADAGRSFKGVAVGRSREARTAPLVRSTVLTITSGAPAGYTTGLRTEYFSSGGDSGGPLFLVENGRVTHKVVGVERQPEPGTGADWFSRVDAAVLALIRR